MRKKQYKFSPIVLLMGMLISLIFGQESAYAINYPKIDYIVQEYEKVYEGEEQTLDIVTAYEGKVQYKVWIHTKGTDIWEEITKGYTEVVEGNMVYSITTPKLLEGEYDISVWVKREGTAPKDNRGFDNYAVTTIKCGKPNPDNEKFKFNTFKSNYSLGDTVEIKRESLEECFFQLMAYDILKDKESASFNDYEESISWNPKEEGVYLLKLAIKSREKVNPPENKAELKTENNDKENKNNDKENQNTEQTQEVQYKEIETKINKVVIVGNPYKEKLPKAPEITSLVVGNAGEVEKIYIKAEPKSNSKNLGYIYGSLNGVKILKNVDKYYYIEATNYDTLNVVKGYVYTWQLKTIKPKEGHSILVDLSEQEIYVFNGEKLEKTITCSTGEDWTPTPKGRYLIGDRGDKFYTGYKNSIVCYNWIRINNDFLFHSVLHDRNGNVIKSEEEKLGQKASHGCIRMSVDDIKWMYNNIPKGTLVVIED